MAPPRALLLKAADILDRPSPPPEGGWLNDMPEAFAALNADGSIMCVGYLGEWFFPRKPSLRARIRNRVVSLL